MLAELRQKCPKFRTNVLLAHPPYSAVREHTEGCVVAVTGYLLTWILGDFSKQLRLLHGRVGDSTTSGGCYF